MNATTGLSRRGRVLAEAAGFLAIAAGTVGFLHVATQRPDPRYATPRAALETYIRCVLAVDEAGELATATPELRARAERQRGPDPALRHERLKGKSAMFRQTPIRFVREKIWGDRAKILVAQGGPPELPDSWVYSFEKIGREWKISNMERTGQMGW
jgi:hypothetical protein